MDLSTPKIQRAFDWLTANNGKNFLTSEELCPTRDIFQGRLEHLNRELEIVENAQHIHSLLVAIVGEIGNNAYDHNLGNWKDERGTYFAYDLAKRSIIVADRGQGVLATLKRIRPHLTTENEAIRVAFTEIISGRSPEQRGNGLKFVESVVRKNGLKVYFYSGDGMFIINNGIHQGSDNKLLRGVLAIISF